MRYLCAFLMLLVVGRVAPAAEFAIDKPTSLRIVVRLEPHPNFTSQFQRDYKRDLRNGIQEALGNLGVVEVVYDSEIPDTDADPLLKLVRTAGLAALDGYNRVGGDKTHFVQLEFRQGRYHMLVRQYDGSIGFATPLIRRSSTTDRAFLARTTSLSIGRDFGMTADIVPVKGETQTIRLRGGRLSGPMSRWVGPGDLFALVALKAPARRPGSKDKGDSADELLASRVDGVLLQVTKEPIDGRATARLLSRYADSLPTGRGIVGYRAIRLGTINAPLKLRLVDENKRLVEAGSLSIQADPKAFPEKDGEGTRLKNNAGTHESIVSFPGVAFVRITLSDKTIAKIPIEILDESVVVRPIRLEVDAEAKARLEVDIRELISRLTESRLVQEGCFAELLALERAGKNDEAWSKAESVRGTMEVETIDIRERLDSLVVRQKRTPVKGADAALNSCESTLEAIRGRQSDLLGHTVQIRAAIDLQKDPAIAANRKVVQDLINRAESLILTADYDGALAAFADAIAKIDVDEGKKAVAVRRDALKALWTTKSVDHANARKFVYENWSRLDTLAAISEGIPKAREAFVVCQRAGDKLTLNKLLLASVQIASRLEDIGVRVTGDTEADKAAIAKIRDASTDLATLLKDVQGYASKPSGS